jgi:hypothetical protein
VVDEDGVPDPQVRTGEVVLLAHRGRLPLGALGIVQSGGGVGRGVVAEDPWKADVQRGLDRPHGEAAALGTVSGSLPPGGAHDLVAEALGEVLEEDPVAVVGRAGVLERVERARGDAELARWEVLAVVVDPVEDPLLHPRRRGLHEPGVLGVVVGELDRVEELVGRGRLQAQDRLLAELRPGEVVVEDAVARGRPLRALCGALGCAVAVHPVRADVLEVDVELAVPAAAAVADGTAVVQRPHLTRPRLLHDVQRPSDPGPARRGVGGPGDPVHTDLEGTGPLGGCPVGVAVGVGLAGRAREQGIGPLALVGVERRQRPSEVSQREGRVLTGADLALQHGIGPVQGPLSGGVPADGGRTVLFGRGRRGRRHGRQHGRRQGQRDGGDDVGTTHVVAPPRVGQVVAEIFSIRAVVEIAGVRVR